MYSAQANVVYNQPYDERVEVSDGEEIASTNATPRGMEQQGEERVWFLFPVKTVYLRLCFH